MKRIAISLYGIISYILAMASLVYLCGFLINFLVPRAIDSPAESALIPALLINTLLLGAFAIQHSVMARPAFKKYWRKIVGDIIERSTFVLFSAIALTCLMVFWQPLGGSIWLVTNETAVFVIYSIYAFGWLFLVSATFLINHFELFGLQQVYQNQTGRVQSPDTFKTPLLYKLVRHPIYTGMLILLWATPTMTISHLVFAIGATGYIVVGTYFEEYDLVKQFGERYRAYQQQVPRLIPGKRYGAIAGDNLPLDS